MFIKKEFEIVSNLILDLLAGQISCSVELSMKKSFITSGPDHTKWTTKSESIPSDMCVQSFGRKLFLVGFEIFTA